MKLPNDQLSYDEYCEFVKDKKVLILGPAKCLHEDLSKTNVDKYDLICALNLHERAMLLDRKLSKIPVSILYHCFNPEQYSKKDLIRWKSNKNLVVVSRNDFSSCKKNHRKVKNLTERNNDIKLNICQIPNSFFLGCSKKMKAINPSTGVLAIFHLLAQQATVSAVGFDFYRSSYWNKKIDLARIRKGEHKPDAQFEYFKKEIKQFGNQFIPIGVLHEMLKD